MNNMMDYLIEKNEGLRKTAGIPQFFSSWGRALGNTASALNEGFKMTARGAGRVMTGYGTALKNHPYLTTAATAGTVGAGTGVYNMYFRK